MSLQDPIADMLVRIKNAQAVSKKNVSMPASKLKMAIARVLHEEGYIDAYSDKKEDGKTSMTIELKYFHGQPVIARLERVSKPSLRVYQGKEALPNVENGLGIAIVTTPAGVMTADKARQLGVGGEVLCVVS